MFLGLMRHAYAATAKQCHVYDEQGFRKLMFLGLTRHAYAETNNGTRLTNESLENYVSWFDTALLCGDSKTMARV